MHVKFQILLCGHKICNESKLGGKHYRQCTCSAVHINVKRKTNDFQNNNEKTNKQQQQQHKR